AARAARAGHPTVEGRLAEWQEARHDAWSHRYRNEVARLARKLIVPKLGDRPLDATDRQDWTALVAAIRKKAPATAAWLYSVVSSFLNHAEAHGWIIANPLPRRGKGRIAPGVAPRARVLDDEELARVWHASAGLSPKTRCFTRFLIMTAARRDE